MTDKSVEQNKQERNPKEPETSGWLTTAIAMTALAWLTAFLDRPWF